MPTFKGVKARRVRDYAWRQADPERDFDLNGDPIQNVVAIVRRADCYIDERDGYTYIDPKDAPCIPLWYGATWYGYGPWRWDKRHQVWRCSQFFVHDGLVYRGALVSSKSYEELLPRHQEEQRLLREWKQRVRDG